MQPPELAATMRAAARPVRAVSHRASRLVRCQRRRRRRRCEALSSNAPRSCDSRRNGISSGTPLPEYVPAVVVGSGYGGSVSALRLGEAGVGTLVLEMGRAWQQPGRDGNVFCRTLQPDGRAMWLRTRTKMPLNTLYGIPIDQPIARYTGVLDRIDYPDMAVYVGRGVGGGSLVNGGMAVTPRRQEFEQIFPQVDAAEMYSTYFPRANAALEISEVPEAWFEDTPIHQFSRLARDQAERCGFPRAFVPSTYDYGYMQDEAAGHVRRSATAQEVFFGNNRGKRTLDQTYLPRALATGHVQIAALRTVSNVAKEPDGLFVLTVKELDTAGRVRSTQQLRTRTLVLAAGSIGTTELLLRAREHGTLPGLSAAVGQGWGNNGNVTATRLNRPDQRTGTRQTTMPAMGIDLRDDPHAALFAEITPMPTGWENHSSAYLAIVNTPERGRLRYDAATDRAVLHWSRRQSAPAVQALKRTLDQINRRERSWYRRDLYWGGRSFGDTYTWHPLGGCVLGEATDDYGRVRGCDGLYVNDSSLIPGYASVNPFVTITALAERNVEAVIAEDLG